MKRLSHPFFVVGLLACFLFVSGAFTGQAVKHTFHHAHHKAATHANPLCSWMCAAGQVLQVHEFGINGAFSILFSIEDSYSSLIPSVLAWSPPLRGPPVSLSIS